MSARINTNIEALAAQRNLACAATVFSKSVERLSSGLRINRAADDSAGLAISEKLRSQVMGLNQARRNAQDGVSMVQTAEGALTEVHSMLQRIRELSVQAANSTLSLSDISSVATEITALRAEIDRISRSTTFNGHRLLDGSLGKTATASGLSAITGALPGGAPIRAGSLAAGAYALTAVAGGGGSGTASTIGGATGLGTSNNPPGFSAATTIDSTTDGLLTQSGGSAANTVSGLAALGAGLGGVSTFVSGSLAADQYVLSVTNPGHVSTIGGANTSATVSDTTDIRDPVDGLWTTTNGEGTPVASVIMWPITLYDFNSNGFGTGGVYDDPYADSTGNLQGEWSLTIASGGSSVSDATFTLIENAFGGQTINLANTGGLLTDAASGFHMDLSGLTGAFTAGKQQRISVLSNRGANIPDPTDLVINDGAGGQTTLSMMSVGWTFQDFAREINKVSTDPGKARVTASVGAHGLMLTSLDNDASNISVRSTTNVLTALGFMAPTSTVTSGQGNANNVYATVTGTGAVADDTVATLTGATSYTVYNLTNTGNVWSHAGTGFSIDLSAVTGGTLNPGFALLGVGGGGTSITLTDETNLSATLSLTAGETFSQVITAINNSGLAIHAAFGTGGLMLSSTGTNLAATIKVRGSDDTLRGLGLEAADASAASTINSVVVTGSLGTAGGGTTITLTGQGAPVSLANSSGVYSDAGSGFSIDLSGAASLSSGTATITVSGSGAQFQIGANEGDFLAVSFADTTVTAVGYGDWNSNITSFQSAAGSGNGVVAAAQALITAVDAAIAYVSTTRGNLGAIQNRLEHTTASIAVASESLNASMSRIKDLDVASEMVNFTKMQILQQAGTAILAQANSAPQGILALLR